MKIILHFNKDLKQKEKCLFSKMHDNYVILIILIINNGVRFLHLFFSLSYMFLTNIITCRS